MEENITTTVDLNDIEKEIFTNQETLYREVHVGHNLAKVRRDKGYSQEYVATQLGVCLQTISRIEKDPKINPKYFQKLADILGKSTDYILNVGLDRVIESIQNIYNGGKGVISDYSTNTNTLDVIQYIIAENKEMHKEMLKEKDETIRSLKTENKALRTEITRLKTDNISLSKISK